MNKSTERTDKDASPVDEKDSKTYKEKMHQKLQDRQKVKMQKK